MKFLRIGTLAALLLLAGCATPPVRQAGDQALLAEQAAREQALAGVEHWQLQGRLYVSNGKDSGTGNLEWTQDGERYAFVVRAPVTGKSFRLSGGPEGATLEGLAQGPLRGDNAQTLMRQALGWNVPLRDLRAWVLDDAGRPLILPQAQAGLAAGVPLQLLGYPVVIDQAVASIGDQAKFAGFGNWREAYILRQVNGFHMLRLDELYAVNGFVGFLGWARYDGAVQNPNAYVVLAGENTA